MVMGNKMFEITDYIAANTGIKPYVMTNGKLLSKETIQMAKQHNVSSFVVSVENPFDVSNGAVDSRETIEKFALLQNEDVPLYFGMMVIANNQFKNILKIADLFFESTGTIPPICEINYLPYESPSDEELADLYENVKSVVRKYNGKTPLSLFPYTTTTIPFSIRLDTASTNNDTDRVNINSGDAIMFTGLSSGAVKEYVTSWNINRFYDLEQTFLLVNSESWGKALAGDYTATITFSAEVVVE